MSPATMPVVFRPIGLAADERQVDQRGDDPGASVDPLEVAVLRRVVVGQK